MRRRIPSWWSVLSFSEYHVGIFVKIKYVYESNIPNYIYQQQKNIVDTRLYP